MYWWKVEKCCTAGQAMRITCCIAKATKTLSKYVILIAFPQQQCLRERASLLRHTSTACIVLLLK